MSSVEVEGRRLYAVPPGEDRSALDEDEGGRERETRANRVESSNRRGSGRDRVCVEGSERASVPLGIEEEEAREGEKKRSDAQSQVLGRRRSRVRLLPRCTTTRTSSVRCFPYRNAVDRPLDAST